MLDGNKDIKFEKFFWDDYFDQYDILENDKMIGMVTLYAMERICNDWEVFFTWVFFDDQEKEDLIYFIQERECETLDRMEDKIFGNDGSFYDYKTRVIVNGKEIRSSAFGHDFDGGLIDE